MTAQGPVLVLDSEPIWIRQLFMALGELTPTVGLRCALHRWRWLSRRRAAHRAGWVERELHLPPRAFGRLAEVASPLHKRLLLRACPDPRAVVFTSPLQRAWAPVFRGVPRIYYATDDFNFHYGYPPSVAYAYEAKLVRHVERVVVVSEALRQSFLARYRCPAERVRVSANAFPARFLPPRCPSLPAPLPPGLSHLRRPVAGLLGQFGPRLRVGWVRSLVERLPWLSLGIVGGVEEEALAVDPSARVDLAWLRSHPRCAFTGALPYEGLFRYAASLDVAILPYAEDGQNAVGSAVRFYTQLPFGQPILASPGFTELEALGPLVRMCGSVAEMAEALEELLTRAFDDGRRVERWLAAREHTWEARARGFLELLAELGCA